MTLTTDQGFTLDFRANMLRGLAERWDGVIFAHDHWLAQRDFSQAQRNISTDRLIDNLAAQAAEYADPLLPRTEIRGGMEALRDAVNALARFELGDGWDGDEDPEKARYSDETVLALLNGDIDNALWALLSSEPACFWCSRRKDSVTRWNPRERDSSRCAQCQAMGR